ncbi:MAG: LytTR family transcriptional regulator DNA-binding domain-containing protein [Defluviitaleaceae bacterium]|nr:LytTR family transcriptional regulator DNA-binding domain-containing protein [Defluviitaleaceae bacterium]
MIIKLEQDSAVNKGELIIKYSELDKETIHAIAHLELINTKIKCTSDTSEVFVKISSIFYFESVDKTTFVYCEKNVYETELRLYKVVENFALAGFVQISKSCVLNIRTLDSIAPSFNSKTEATLTNGERVYISRSYLKGIKEALEGIKK